ncbi:hypothetical protein ACQJBY_040140 [Aegilops geniculata]
MDKYTIGILALALLSLHLVCCATIAQCRIMADTDSDKINLPHGLCAYEPKHRCTNPDVCVCCTVDGICYVTMDECKKECKKTSSSEDILLAMTSPPLSAP